MGVFRSEYDVYIHSVIAIATDDLAMQGARTHSSCGPFINMD